MKKPKGHWTFERCQEEALKHKTRVAWRIENESSFQAAYRKGWLDGCTKHMDNDGKRKTFWTLEKLQKESKKYKSRTEWKQRHRASYAAAQRLQLLNQCTEHMKRPYRKKKKNRYWTLERCQEKASEYSTRSAWSKGHQSSYQTAYRNGWLDLCTLHMMKKPNEILQLALSKPWRKQE